MASIDDYELFLRIFKAQPDQYLQRVLSLMNLQWTEFIDIFKHTGQVFGVYDNDELTGFFWIEVKERTLQLYTIIILEEYRGMGIGSEVMNMLFHLYASSMDCIELGVRENNTQAIALYERLGFNVVKKMDELGFLIMQRDL